MIALLAVAAFAAPDSAEQAPAPALTESATDGPLTAHLRVTPANPAPGAVVELRIVADVGADPAILVEWPDVRTALTDALGADVVDVDTARADAGGRSFTAHLRLYDEGDQGLPELRVSATRGADRVAEVTLDGVTLHVDADVAEDAEPAPAKDALPLVVPPAPFAWAPVALGAAALAALVLALILWRRRKRAATPPPPPPPAHEKALAALRSLAARALPEHGEVEPYFVELSEILRTYLEDRFALRAPEQTTEEFLTSVSSTAAGRRAIESAHRDVLRDFLTRADLVKFARARPARDECAAAGVSAERFVNDTAAPAAPTAPSEVSG